MAASSSCPTTNRLRQLVTGTVSAAEQAELIAHLDHCVACRRLLDQLAGASPALLAAAGALHTTTHEEAPLRRVLDALGSDPSLSSQTWAHGWRAWWPSLLRPAESLEPLGQLDGYEVTDVIGQGGMGLVFKAFDLGLKRWVAIKVLAPNVAGNPVARLRFAREAQTAAAVRHEHVITIHAVSEANGLPYFVMEYLTGGSLQDYLDLHGPPDWRAVARLGAEVASGLAAAHAQGLIHRDIKPSNILLGPGEGPGLAKISDFGLARVADEARLTQTGFVAGTPMYMAPEQARGEEVDHRADLFSLGSVLYTLCTGKDPFPSSSPLIAIQQVCEATPVPIHKLNPTIPLWLAAVVECLHAKRRGDRFASAAEMAELIRYNLEHPDRPRLVPRLHRARRHQGPARLLVMAGFGLLVMAGLILSAPFLRTDPPGWEMPGGEQQDRVPLQATLRRHKGPVWSVAFSLVCLPTEKCSAVPTKKCSAPDRPPVMLRAAFGSDNGRQECSPTCTCGLKSGAASSPAR